jgi:Holliday junction resolvase RusA-like endonuclease
MGQLPLHSGPIAVAIAFFLPRPKAHYRTGVNADKLRRSAPLVPTTAPDIDKLVRGTLDGLSSIVIRDDSQIVWIQAYKGYADQSQVGARIMVTDATKLVERILSWLGFEDGRP